MNFWKNTSKRKSRYYRDGLNLFSMRDVNRLKKKTWIEYLKQQTGKISSEARLPGKA